MITEYSDPELRGVQYTNLNKMGSVVFVYNRLNETKVKD